MERKFYPESFEKFLKGHADQFKMTPSKKAWHGIYNDLHPGRRWPSVTMSLVFIFALVIVGHLNTNEYTQILSATSSNRKSSTSSNLKNITNVSTSIPKHNIMPTNTLNSTTASKLINSSTPALAENNVSREIHPKAGEPSSESSLKNIPSDLKENSSASPEKVLTGSASPYNEPKNKDLEISNLQSKENQDINTSSENNEFKTVTSVKATTNKNTTKAISADEASLRIKKIRKNPAVISYNIAPSLSYRNFSDDKMNNLVTHKIKLGYEAGIGISYKIKNQLRFITGLQLNYSGYNIKASNTHPILATLILNTDVPSQYNIYSTVSSHGNGTGNENSTLKNYSLQAAIPIGLQYSFGGNENFKFDAEANFQPTAIIKSKAYMLSTDAKNYLLDPFIYRKWNMSTNIGAYITFTSDSYKWHIGPQMRYQMLSTYSKDYPVKEHLINYGIRVGISK